MVLRDEFITIIIDRAKDKLKSGENQGHEIIVGIIAMSKEYDIDSEALARILESVYEGNKAQLLTDLRFASKLIDQHMIDDIIAAVK